VIAVSDGGGSYKFSRVGAKVSCERAVQFLGEQLSKRPLRVRPGGVVERWFSKDDGYFVSEDIKFVQDVLTYAMRDAYDAVERAAKEREDSQPHRRFLKANRKLGIEDLSATLLLAVTTRLMVKGVEWTFAMTCAVGDGMMTMIAQGDPPVQLLAEPDSGAHSGETYFLTSRGRLDSGNLASKTFTAFRPMHALMVMTDGVADDYFPPQTEMLRLYSDLVLNRIVKPLPGARAVSLPPNLEQARVAAEIDQEILAADPQRFRIRSAIAFAEKLKLNVKDLVSSADLIRLGAMTDSPDTIIDPAERLCLWLDAYQVRGSFDDRTLVVLHRPE
jgi:hypothetical protein